MSIEQTPEKLNLVQIQNSLRNSRVEISRDESRNPIEIASALGLIQLSVVEEVETGYYDKVDEHKMLADGRIVQPIAFGQQVLQAVTLNDGTIR